MIIASSPVCHRLLAPRIAYLIGTLGSRGPNLAPISNLTQASSRPQKFVAAISREGRTCANIRDTRGFALSVPREEHIDVVWRLGEKFSGYTIPAGVDKLTASGGTFDFQSSRFGPILADCVGWCDCEIELELPVGDGDHALFLARVLGGGFNPHYLHTDGTYTQNSRPLMQLVLNRFCSTDDSWEQPWLGDRHA